MLSPILLATASTPMWFTWQSQNPTGNALYTTPSPKGCAGLSCRLYVAYMPQSATINRSQPVPCALTSVALPARCMHKILNIFEPRHNTLKFGVSVCLVVIQILKEAMQNIICLEIPHAKRNCARNVVLYFWTCPDSDSELRIGHLAKYLWFTASKIMLQVSSKLS